ncbi:MAG: hypothetical protein ACRD1F_05265 [Terriglobales bacterium]
MNAGSPIVFLHNGQTYLVLTPKDGMPLPKAVYNDLGDPGVTVHGQVIDSHGVRAIGISSVSE